MTTTIEHDRTTLLPATCDECSCTITPTLADVQGWVAYTERFAPHLAGSSLQRSTASAAGWVVHDENDQDVMLCPACVEATKVARASQTCPSWCVTDHAAETHERELCFQHAPAVNFVCSTLPNVLNVSVEGLVDVDFPTHAFKQRREIALMLRAYAEEIAAAAKWLDGRDA